MLTRRSHGDYSFSIDLSGSGYVYGDGTDIFYHHGVSVGYDEVFGGCFLHEHWFLRGWKGKRWVWLTRKDEWSAGFLHVSALVRETLVYLSGHVECENGFEPVM